MVPEELGNATRLILASSSVGNEDVALVAHFC